MVKKHINKFLFKCINTVVFVRQVDKSYGNFFAYTGIYFAQKLTTRAIKDIINYIFGWCMNKQSNVIKRVVFNLLDYDDRNTLIWYSS